MGRYSTSANLFERAQRSIPGGVNSPARAFGAVGGVPPFIDSGSGATIVDVDGNQYVDYVGSWGPFILGHSHPSVAQALETQLQKGTSFGAPTEREVEFADFLVSSLPWLDSVRLVNSGTEATMSAIRLARGYTGREKIVKFEGCYHGHGDAFLVKSGSGMLTHGSPSSPGVPSGTVEDTLVASFNDIESVRTLFEQNRDRIAAVILEPIAGNMGVIPSGSQFLRDLRDLCTSEQSLLVFDEVMTGFRIGFGGATEAYGITPDLVTYGKIIGGGLPVGAFGGRSEVMNVVSPVGPVYQAGTLSGNPLAVSAGLATLRELKDSSTYENLEKLGQALETGLTDVIESAGIEATINRVGSMLSMFFTPQDVVDFSSASSSNTEQFGRFFHRMLDRGHYLPPSQFESWFLSAAHSDENIDRLIRDAAEFFESGV